MPFARPNELAALSAEAQAYGHLPGAIAGSGEKQVRNVHAGDEQQHDDNGHHDG
jgi:hypothetical protein